MRVSHFWLGFQRCMITILILITFKNVSFDFAASLKLLRPVQRGQITDWKKRPVS